MQWYVEVLKKYAVFSGRARRKEFWMFALVNIIAVGALGIIDGLAGTFDEESGFGLFSSIYGLAIP